MRDGASTLSHKPCDWDNFVVLDCAEAIKSEVFRKWGLPQPKNRSYFSN